MIKVKDGYAKLIGTTYSGSSERVLLSNGGDFGLHTGRNNEANKLVRTDASGYILTGWINTTSGDMGTTAVTRIYCSNDNFIRYKTPANFFSSLTNSGDNISITVASQNRTLTVLYANIAGQLRSKGTIAPLTGRTLNLGDVYSYHLNSLVSGGPTTYAAVIGFGRGVLGTVEIAGEWTSGRGLWVRALRDTTDNWYSWDKVLTLATYTGITDSRYYTKTLSDERFVNITGDTMTGELISTNDNAYRLRGANYGVILRNDNSSFWILTTDNGSPSGSFNSLRPFSIKLSDGRVTLGNGLSVTGTIVGSSTILGTLLISTIASGTSPLKVTSTTLVNNLNVDLLDGWHGVGTSSYVIRKSGYLASNTSGLSSYWGKVGSFTWLSQYNDRDITLYMHSAYDSLRAIVLIRARWESASKAVVSVSILAGNIPTNRIRLYYDSSSVSSTLELWYNISGLYGCINTYVLSDTSRVGLEIGHITLYNTEFSSVQTPSLSSYVEANYVSLLNNSLTATKLLTARTINGTSFDGSSNITTAIWGTARNITIGKTTKSVNGSGNYSWSLSEIGVDGAYLPLSGGTMSGTINSTLVTSTYLYGNQGRTLINSTASAGSYVMLFRGNSTNGYFTHGVFQNKYLLLYTSKTTVDAGTNSVSKSVTLLDENGNTVFPGVLQANRFISVVANGTAPLTVNSTTLVTNLNSQFLNGYSSSDFLRLLKIANSTNVHTLSETMLYWTDTDGNSGTLTNSAFTGSHAMILVKNYINDTEYRRSRIAFDGYGVLKTFNDRSTAGNGGIWYTVLTNANYSSIIDASKYFTALTSNAATNLTVTIGGTTKSIANLYARYLSDAYTSRLASMNVSFGDGTLRTFKATSTTTTGKPAGDAHIVHLAWDNTSGYDGLIALPTNSGRAMQWRVLDTGTWCSWKTLVDNSNYSSIVLKLGTATKGSATLPIYLDAGIPTACNTTLGVSITGNAATSTKLTSSAGSSILPVYFSDGKPIACAYLHHYYFNNNNVAYIKLFTLKISGTYTNTPITFKIKGRSGREAFVAIRYTNGNSNDPSISYFRGWGGYSGYYTRLRIYKSTTSTWEVWKISQIEGYDTGYVWDVLVPYNISFTWNNTTSDSLPTYTTYTDCTVETITANLSGSADMLDGYHANGLFTNLSNSGNNLSVTIGGVNKILTVLYSSTTSWLDTNSTLRYGSSGLNYFNLNGTAGTAANSNVTPTSNWYHILRMNHSNSSGYFVDIAIPFNDLGGVWWRLIRSGTNYGWFKILDTNNFAGTLDSRYVTLATNQTISGTKTFSTLLKFTVATGTSPFTVSSTTVVSNLNADLLDGVQGDYYFKRQGRLGEYNIDTLTEFASRDILPSSEVTISGTKPFNTWGTLLTFKSLTNNGGIQIAGSRDNRMYFRSIYNSSFSNSNWNTLAYLTDNVASASKWKTARKITLTGSVTGEVSIDGSGDVTLSTTTNHTHNYLPLSGGTMTGVLSLLANQYTDGYNGALNCNNSDIYGLNSIYTADLSDTQLEGIHFYRTTSTVDTFRIKNGVMYFAPNRTLGGTATEYTIMHSGNYGSWASEKSHTHTLKINGSTKTIAATGGTAVDLGSYLPLSGGTMTGNITYNAHGTSYIGNGPNDAANGVGGALNNLVISSWYGVSFTTSCGSQTYTGTNAVSINCRNGHVYANTFVGTLSGHASSATKLTSSAGSATLPIYFSDGKPVACTAASVFSNLSNSGNNISITVAGQNRTLTVGYAGNSNTVDGYHQGNAVHYTWTNTYTQPTSGATWYLKIKTTDWKNTSDWIWVSCEGNNAHDEYVINTGSRSTAWWAYGVQYTTQLINGCTKIISNSCDTYIRLTSSCTSVRLYTTFTPASVTNDSASSYTTIVPGLNAPTFYGNATSATNADTVDGYHASAFALSGHTHSYVSGNAGSTTQGIYVSGNTVKAMTYSLSATVNSGTSNKLAYYSGANAISLYSSTVGNSAVPVYISNGVPTALSNYSFRGTFNQPVILASGYVYRSSVQLNTWYWNGYMLSDLSFNTYSVNDGVFHILFSSSKSISSYTIAIALINLNFWGESTTGLGTTSGTYDGRGTGNPNLTCSCSISSTGINVNIRAYRATDKNNDSWTSYSGLWKLEKDSIKSVNIIVIGYISD